MRSVNQGAPESNTAPVTGSNIATTTANPRSPWTRAMPPDQRAYSRKRHEREGSARTRIQPRHRAATEIEHRGRRQHDHPIALRAGTECGMASARTDQRDPESDCRQHAGRKQHVRQTKTVLRNEERNRQEVEPARSPPDLAEPFSLGAPSAK